MAPPSWRCLSIQPNTRRTRGDRIRTHSGDVMTARSVALVCVASAFLTAGGQVRSEPHRFTPQIFYNTYSAAHPPALRIRPGDRVSTKTVDASGVDWNGKTVAAGGNPETGPFYVEGAEPDDTLVVTFERIEPNRPTAFSASLLAPYAVDPASIAGRVDREAKRLIWNIDKAKGVARI